MEKLFSRSGKKGSAVIEGLTVLVIAVIFAIGGMYGYLTFNELNANIQNDSEISNVSKDMSTQLANTYPTWIDNMFLFMFVMFVVFVLVSVFFIDSHPIFFAIAIILLLAVFVAAIFLGNAFDELASDPTVSGYANNLPYIAWVMSHIVELIVAIGFITSIALFVKIKMA